MLSKPILAHLPLPARQRRLQRPPLGDAESTVRISAVSWKTPFRLRIAERAHLERRTAMLKKSIPLTNVGETGFPVASHHTAS